MDKNNSAKIAILIGGAGTGKTTELLRLMSKAIEAGGYDVRDIGFCSFTRAARAEAAARAASIFDCNPNDLERDGWFRTLHSIAYKQLAVGDELIDPGAKGQKWIQEAIQEEISGTFDGPLEDAGDRVSEATDADKVLHLYSLSRNRIVPFEVVYEEVRASTAVELRWDLNRCRSVIDRYERAKRLDHRCDFTDLLARFAGWAFPGSRPLQVTPEGECPKIPVLFIDEAQDNTALMDAGFRRMAENARWVYLSGDPFQAIYGWNGSDHTLFRSWPHAKSRTLEQSFRCPSAILDRGEQCLRPCGDYWDRGIKPVAAGGQVIDWASKSDWSDIEPTSSWLLLARTNFQARRLMGMLKEDGIPWEPIKGNGGWKKSKKRGAVASLCGLELGDAVSFTDWGDVISAVPSKARGAELLEHGLKSHWAERQPASDNDFRTLSNLGDWGATETLRRMIAEGNWCQLVDNGHEFRAAHRRFGWGGVLESKVRVGTIHAAKGMEADNVVVLTTTSRPVWAAADSDPRQADEEKRLAYVAVTRARERVFLMTERSQYRMEALAQ